MILFNYLNAIIQFSYIITLPITLLWLLYYGEFTFLIVGIIVATIASYVIEWSHVVSGFLVYKSMKLHFKNLPIACILLLLANLFDFFVLFYWCRYILYTATINVMSNNLFMPLLMFAFAVTFTPLSDVQARSKNKLTSIQHFTFGLALFIQYLLILFTPYKIESYYIFLSIIVIGFIFSYSAKFVITRESALEELDDYFT